MRTSTVVWILLVLIIIIGGGWYYHASHMAAPPASTGAPAQAPGQNTAAGINNSPDQGNLGQPDNGQVQQPGADGAEGTIIGGNVALGVGKSDTLGAYLIGYNGMTVYMFAKDKTASSTCYGPCAQIWPPYTIGAEDNAQNVKLGISANKVGTITRADGSIQVTYNGHPLYFYAQDKSSTDTLGQNIGKVWFVVKP
jgi:predicted lipoprotein with Yx(FWY)xxD motif